MQVFTMQSNQRSYGISFCIRKIKGITKYNFHINYGYRTKSFSWGEN